MHGTHRADKRVDAHRPGEFQPVRNLEFQFGDDDEFLVHWFVELERVQFVVWQLIKLLVGQFVEFVVGEFVKFERLEQLEFVLGQLVVEQFIEFVVE